VATLTVGPSGTHPTIADALLAASPGDTIALQAGYSGEAALVTVENITVTGDVSSTGIVLTMDTGVIALTLGGDAPINVFDNIGDNTIIGNAGDNVINVSGGADNVAGGVGIDRVVVDYSSASAAAITGIATSIPSNVGTATMSGFEHYTVYTASGADTIYILPGDTFLSTGEGVSTTVLGDGNNTVLAGSGADTITVGTGSNYINSGDGVSTIVASAVGFGDNIIVTGTGADTVSVGHGNNNISGGSGIDTGLDTIVAGNGNNCIDGGDGANNTITVGNGDNHILGGVGPGTDAITVGNGNNFIDAEGGTNVVTAGTGNNYIVTGDGQDAITAMGGNNNIQTGAGTNTVTTGTGNDVIVTGVDADTVTVGTGNNIVFSFGGADVLTAGAGHDLLNMDYSASSDGIVTAITGAGPYTGSIVAGTFGNVVITGFDEFNITGGSAADYIVTFDGADVLDGGAGADTLNAGLGSDVIYGGAGDIITGGEDADGLDHDVLVLNGLGGGTLVYDAGSTENGTFTLNSGGSLSFTGIEHVVFDATTITTPEDTPLVGNLNLAAGVSVTTFDVGNITYPAGSTASRAEGDLTINANGSYTFTPALNYNGPAPVISYTDSNGVTTPLFIEVTPVDEVIPHCLTAPCFTPGTMIDTADGRVAVEKLTVGDMVLTRDHGHQPIRWIGSKQLDAATLRNNPELQPILISQGALGRNEPDRDMMVSRQHRMLVSGWRVQLLFGCDDTLVKAAHLLGLAGVKAAELATVTYVHIMFDHHEVVLADGAWSESFQPGEHGLSGLDTGQRDELFTVFPELRSSADIVQFDAAFQTLKAYEARVLFAA